MKVRINGYDIECTPQEFKELTGGKPAENSLGDIQRLPDDISLGPHVLGPYVDHIEPYRLPDDYRQWIKPSDPVTAYGCPSMSQSTGVTPAYTEKDYEKERYEKRRADWAARRERTEKRRISEYPEIGVRKSDD